MQKLLIRDFSLQAHCEFVQPVSEEQAALSKLAEQMLTAFPYVLRTEDISLFSQTRLFDYRLMFKLYNGSADVTFTNKNVTSNFRDGKTEQALRLVAAGVVGINKIMVTRPIQSNTLTFAVHVQFESSEGYDDYMKGFVNSEQGYLSGGKIFQADARYFKGELRFSTEKSVMVQNGLYISFQFLTQETFATDLLEKMAKRFIEILAFEGFELKFS